MKNKLIVLAVIAVPLLIIIGAGWFVWQVESYMKTNDARVNSALDNDNYLYTVATTTVRYINVGVANGYFPSIQQVQLPVSSSKK